MKIIRDLIEGLKYLHSDIPGKKPPILHKDIKSENLMVTIEGNLIIIDLGISLLTAKNQNDEWILLT